MKVIIALIIVFIKINSFSQEVIPLYEDSEVTICFKRYNEQYAYITEQYEGAYHGALVKYELTGDVCKLTELDESKILVDSIVLYSENTSQNDSLILSSCSRIQAFPNAYGFFQDLVYIINDTLKIQASSQSNDPNHQVRIKKIKAPYKLEMSDYNHHYGPFIIDSDNDIRIMFFYLLSVPNEYDFAKLLPKTITMYGKKYQLQHSFEPWD